MKRITVVTPATGLWILAKQPFHRCLLLASLQGLNSADSEPRIVAYILDVSGHVIWRQSVAITGSNASDSNVVFSVQGCETETSRTSDATDFGSPLPADLTIPANYTLEIQLQGWSGNDTTPNLVLTTDDPFLDGARPFDDLQAP
jgi:hypothetical protein